MRKINYFVTVIAAAASVFATSCENESKLGPIDNAVYIEQATPMAGYTKQVLNLTIPGSSESVPVTIRLARPAKEDVHVTVAMDLQSIDEYNEANGKAYQLLPDEYYTIKKDLTIKAGGTSASTDLTTVKDLPDGSYALAVRIASVEGPVEVRGDGNKILYLLKSPNKQTVPTFAPRTSGYGSPTTVLNMQLNNWTVEYWVYFEDTSTASVRNSASTGGAWDSGNPGAGATGGAGWRFYVFPAETQVISGINNFQIFYYPLGGEASCPNMQFKPAGGGAQIGNTPRVKLDSTDPNIYKWVPEEWCHFALTYTSDDTLLRLYINGIPQKFDNGAFEHESRADLTNWGTLKIGETTSNTQSGRYPRFRIAQLRLWNRALNESDLATNMSSALGGDEEGLVGYWKMNETSGSVFKDSNLNGETHDLQFSGSNKVYAINSVVNFSNPNGDGQ